MLAGPGVIPRVLPLCSILYWFSLQVSNRVLLHVTCCSTLLLTTFIAVKMQNLVAAFSTKVLASAMRFQSFDTSCGDTMVVYTMDTFGQELQQCMKGLPAAEVHVHMFLLGGAFTHAFLVDECGVEC